MARSPHEVIAEMRAYAGRISGLVYPDVLGWADVLEGALNEKDAQIAQGMKMIGTLTRACERYENDA